MPITFYVQALKPKFDGDMKAPDLSNIKQGLRTIVGKDERDIHLSFSRVREKFLIQAAVRVDNKVMGEYEFDEKHTILGDNDEQIINAIAEMIPSPN